MGLGRLRDGERRDVECHSIRDAGGGRVKK